MAIKKPKEFDWLSVLEWLDKGLGYTFTGDNAEKLRKGGHYPYIPLPLPAFVRQMEQVRALTAEWPNYPRFLDVGCGVGTKLIIASRFGFAVNGIDVCDDYVALAQRIVGKDRISKADGRKYDYAPYDVIYFYCPMVDEKKERPLEQRIVTTAKSGALILANLKRGGDDLWYGNEELEHVKDGIIWRKK